MLQKLSIVALTLWIGCSYAAVGGDSLVRFKGGIGVIPVSSAAGVANADGTSSSVSRNVVRGINPPGQIWVIADPEYLRLSPAMQQANACENA